VATPSPKRNRPRIRKTAPTIRQRAEAAQAEAEKEPTTSRLKIKQTTGRLRGNSFSRSLAKVFRPLKGVLRWIIPRYFVNSWREVRQVTWPSRRETWRLTGAVFVFAIIFGVVVAVVDKGLDEIFKKVILR
jgi:preprotein translocase subunit SecE